MNVPTMGIVFSALASPAFWALVNNFDINRLPKLWYYGALPITKEKGGPEARLEDRFFSNLWYFQGNAWGSREERKLEDW